MMCYSGGQQILNNTNITQHLISAGFIRSLDYFSRLVITSLMFSDGGTWSRQILISWLSSRECSPELRAYTLNLLRALLQSRPFEFYRWGLEMLVLQLSFDDSHGSHDNALKVLEEAAESKTNLVAIVAKQPKINPVVGESALLTRFLSIPEGIEYLSRTNWLNTKLNTFRETGFKDYALHLERCMSMALSRPYMKKIITRTVTPITLPVNSNNGDSSTRNVGNDGIDLEGLLRVPWNVEVKLTAQAGYTQSGSLYLKTDTFVDTSSLPSSVDATMTQDGTRIIKIRSVILDSRGLPSGQPIATNLIINNCLLIGGCGVVRSGRLVPPAHAEKSRRRVSASSASAMMMQTGRDSLSNGRNSEVGDQDTPVTFQNDSQDWSYCKPGHRQGHVVEMHDNKFAVEIAGEPCVWIFSRTATTSHSSSSSAGSQSASIRDGNTAFASHVLRRRTGSFSAGLVQANPNQNDKTDVGNTLFGNNRTDASRAGSTVYLVEVQYHLRLETGLPLFIPIGRHVWGELAKSPEGCAMLEDLRCIREMLAIARDTGPHAKSSERRAALWALGHMGSTDLGFAALTAEDPDFLTWCIDLTCCSPEYHMRGTAFQVIGLVSRSSKAQKQLRHLRWDCSPAGSRAAVAMPYNFRDLFSHHSHNHERISAAASYKLPPPPEVCGATPMLNAGTVSPELELINYLLKFPGMLLYKESRAKIEVLRNAHPELLSSRAVFVVVMKILEKYTFKLAARREIVKLFSSHARSKVPVKDRERGARGSATASASVSQAASFTGGAPFTPPSISENMI